MKGSKELIEHYNKRKEELGEKATKLNMYLEGYAEGYRDRKKPTQSWMEKAKYELEHEEELTIERAYELGRVRGRKEQEAIDDDHLREATKMLIKKACDAHCRICDYYSCCPYEFEIEGCHERNEILQVMEE